jgi:hypothetical protein
MAESVKIQGSIQTCLNRLQIYADEYGVNYQAIFPGQSYTIRPKIEPVKKTILLFFHWRNEYNEYDNSV